MYDIPPALSKRTTTLGFGSKYDFTKEHGRGNPAPNAYSSPSDFSAKKPFSAQYTFGISRDLCEKRYIEGNVKADPAVPGPGAYSIRKPAGTDLPKFTIRQRTSYDQPFRSDSNPGPGAYAPKTGISAKGSYFISKYKDSGVSSFSPKSSIRFKPFNKTTLAFPGPGTYKPKFELAPKGDYFVSTYKSSMCRTFSTSPRDSSPAQKALDVPGPGSYRLPSEFGYYESKRASMSATASMPDLKIEANKQE